MNLIVVISENSMRCLRRFSTYRRCSADRNGKENFPQTETENFPFLVSTFLCGQERKAVFYQHVRLCLTTKKLSNPKSEI